MSTGKQSLSKSAWSCTPSEWKPSALKPTTDCSSMSEWPPLALSLHLRADGALDFNHGSYRDRKAEHLVSSPLKSSVGSW